MAGYVHLNVTSAGASSACRTELTCEDAVHHVVDMVLPFVVAMKEEPSFHLFSDLCLASLGTQSLTQED